MGSLIPLFLVVLRFNGSGLDGSFDGVNGIASRVPAALLWPCLAWSAVIAASRLYMGVRPKKTRIGVDGLARHHLFVVPYSWNEWYTAMELKVVQSCGVSGP